MWPFYTTRRKMLWHTRVTTFLKIVPLYKDEWYLTRNPNIVQKNCCSLLLLVPDEQQKKFKIDHPQTDQESWPRTFFNVESISDISKSCTSSPLILTRPKHRLCIQSVPPDCFWHEKWPIEVRRTSTAHTDARKHYTSKHTPGGSFLVCLEMVDFELFFCSSSEQQWRAAI